jgi:hypothetical protein
MLDAIEYGIPEVSSGRWPRNLGKIIKLLSDTLYVKITSAATNDDKSRPERYLEIRTKIREVIQAEISKKRVYERCRICCGIQRRTSDGHDEGDKSSKSRKRASST